jgi:hypothetical protein
MSPVVRRAAALGLATALALGAPASGSEPEARREGPLQGREEWLPSQPRLTLPAASPDVLERGRARLRLELDWGNDFGWSQERRGEAPRERRFLVDGEHRSLALEALLGLGARLELGVRVPLYWRGGGVLDALIDWFHGWTGLPGNARDSFLRDRLRVEGQTPAGEPIQWGGSAGTALGDLELGLKGSLIGGRGGPGWSLGLLGRVTLPTATGSFAGAGAELGGQLLAAKGLGRNADLYLGAGGTWWPETERDGLHYASGRRHGFLGFEWRPARRLSLLVQAEAASRAVRDLAELPGVHSYLRVGARWRLSRRWTLEGGFTENLKHQQATTDFGIGLGLSRSF